MLMISDTAVEACRGQKLLSRCWYTVTYTATHWRELDEKLAGSEFSSSYLKKTSCAHSSIFFLR